MLAQIENSPYNSHKKTPSFHLALYLFKRLYFRTNLVASAAAICTSAAVVAAATAGVYTTASVAAVEKKNGSNDDEPYGGIFKKIAKAVHIFSSLLYFRFRDFVLLSKAPLRAPLSFVHPSLYHNMRRALKCSCFLFRSAQDFREGENPAPSPYRTSAE